MSEPTKTTDKAKLQLIKDKLKEIELIINLQ